MGPPLNAWPKESSSSEKEALNSPQDEAQEFTSSRHGRRMLHASHRSAPGVTGWQV
jgi:hypothetical protein